MTNATRAALATARAAINVVVDVQDGKTGSALEAIGQLLTAVVEQRAALDALLAEHEKGNGGYKEAEALRRARGATAVALEAVNIYVR